MKNAVLLFKVQKKYRKQKPQSCTKQKKKKKGRMILSSNCLVCCSKKSKFTKDQGASGLLSSLGINIPFINKFPIIDRK